MVPRTILRQLAGLRRRERGLALFWGLARALAAAFTVLVLACLADWTIDRWQDTPWTLRYALLAGQALLWIALTVVLVLRPLFRRLSDSQLSLYVEEYVPDLQHRLVSAVQLNGAGAATEGMSGELIAAVTRQAEEQTQGMHFASLADHRRLRWSLALLAPVGLAVALLLLLCPNTVMALLARQFLAERNIPRSLDVESEQAERVCPAGEEVVLRFRVRGRLPEHTQGEVRIAPEGESVEHYPLEFERSDDSGDAVFLARIPPGPADFTYHARLADARTHQPGRVHFEAQPAITQLRAWTQLPEFCGHRPDGKPYEREQPSGDLALLPGSTARVAIHTQKPVQQAYLELLAPTFDDNRTLTGERITRRIDLAIQEDGQEAEGSFTPQEGETVYRVVVVDAHGFRNVDAPRRGIRLQADEQPRVTLLPELFPSPDGQGSLEDFEVSGIPVPLGGTIRVAYTCSSPYGLGRADQNRTPRLRYRVNEGPWRRLPLKEVAASEKTGPFDPRYGAFAKSSFFDQVEYHAVASPDPATTPGRLDGGGRFDLQTRRIPGLKIGDRLEFYLEVHDQNPAPGREPGRSESRIKAIVTLPEVETWVRETLQEESRIRQLEGKQEEVFAAARTPDEESMGTPPAPVEAKPEEAPTAPASPFVRDWQLIGPFPCGPTEGHDREYSVETEKTDLARAYDGKGGKVRWQAHHSKGDRIALDDLYGANTPGVAYGVCWVHSDRARKVMLVVGSDDGIKVWLNRRLVLDRKVNRPAAPGQDQEQIDLKAGWNELRVKVDNFATLWCFYLELREPGSNQAVRGLKFSLTPPRQPSTTFVRQWQLIGPFPNLEDRGHAQAFPPETEKVDLTREYQGILGKVRWKPHAGEADRIDLQQFFEHDRAGVAYAVCWVRASQGKAVLATGSDDGIKVWLNRRVVLDQAVHREAVPGDDRTAIQLEPTWNEILVKVDNRFGTWAFFLELLDAEGRGPLEGVEIRTTPPSLETVRFLRDWQLLGPLSATIQDGYDKAYPPEMDKIDLDRTYPAFRGKAGWKLYQSKEDRIDLSRFFNHQYAGIAYAVCWVHSDHKQPAVFSAGSDDGIKIWHDRKLILGRNMGRPAEPGQDKAPIELKAGWQEVLVKIHNHGGHWAFYLELKDPKTDKPIPGLQVRTTPPDGAGK